MPVRERWTITIWTFRAVRLARDSVVTNARWRRGSASFEWYFPYTGDKMEASHSPLNILSAVDWVQYKTNDVCTQQRSNS